mmetsp:Transcript_57696/g.167123  ORF Transcript_57696/g.167123 Transcript_57696/m.167123 type:complete len:308 (-) Transcript_57696:130-1053(-)
MSRGTASFTCGDAGKRFIKEILSWSSSCSRLSAFRGDFSGNFPANMPYNRMPSAHTSLVCVKRASGTRKDGSLSVSGQKPPGKLHVPSTSQMTALHVLASSGAEQSPMTSTLSGLTLPCTTPMRFMSSTACRTSAKRRILVAKLTSLKFLLMTLSCKLPTVTSSVRYARFSCPPAEPYIVKISSPSVEVFIASAVFTSTNSRSPPAVGAKRPLGASAESPKVPSKMVPKRLRATGFKRPWSLRRKLGGKSCNRKVCSGCATFRAGDVLRGAFRPSDDSACAGSATPKPAAAKIPTRENAHCDSSLSV